MPGYRRFRTLAVTYVNVCTQSNTRPSVPHNGQTRKTKNNATVAPKLPSFYLYFPITFTFAESDAHGWQRDELLYTSRREPVRWCATTNEALNASTSTSRHFAPNVFLRYNLPDECLFCRRFTPRIETTRARAELRRSGP